MADEMKNMSPEAFAVVLVAGFAVYVVAVMLGLTWWDRRMKRNKERPSRLAILVNHVNETHD